MRTDQDLIDRLRIEAQIHSSEARTANSTIYEIYQVISGATGEPGNWHGAQPVRDYVAKAQARIAALEAERDEARGIVRDIYWMALRYADGRKTYAVGMCNDAVRKGYDAGWLPRKTEGGDPVTPDFARDGMDAERKPAATTPFGHEYGEGPKLTDLMKALDAQPQQSEVDGNKPS